VQLVERETGQAAQRQLGSPGGSREDDQQERGCSRGRSGTRAFVIHDLGNGVENCSRRGRHREQQDPERRAPCPYGAEQHGRQREARGSEANHRT